MSSSHGNTPAAWTAVTVMFVGCLVSGVAVGVALPWLFFVGVAIVAVGAVAGKVMAMMGMGNTVSYQDERDPDYDSERSASDTSDDEAAASTREASS